MKAKTTIILINLFLIFMLLETGDYRAMENSGERYSRGYNLLKKLDAEGADNVIKGLQDIAPEMAGFIIEFAYGDIASRPGLELGHREMAIVAALTALGNAKPQLKWHIGAALNTGVTPQQIIEIMYISTVYHGFPAALNGISAAREVFKEKGIKYTPGIREKVTNRRAMGIRTMDKTSKGAGQMVVESLKDIAPEMSGFILEFSYGDIFSRGNLSQKETEIVAIAGMCAAGNQRPQLIVHIRTALYVGLTEKEIIEVIDQIAVYAGFPAALNGISAAREVFKK